MDNFRSSSAGRSSRRRSDYGGDSATVILNADAGAALHHKGVERERRQGCAEPDRFSGAFAKRQKKNGSDAGRRKISEGEGIRFTGSEGKDSRGRRKLGESRREASDSKKSVMRRKGLRLVLLSLIIFSALVFLVYKLLFVVDSVSVDGAAVYSQAEIVDASGIGNGVNLYSFRSSTVKKRITFACPYVSDVKVTRKAPDNVIISVSEDKASYVAEIYGDNILLSDSMRVLEILDGESVPPEGVMKLKLPDIKQALSGRTLIFFDDRADRLARDLVSAVSESELSGRIVSADITDPYDIRLVCDGKYLLSLGDGSDLALKLKTASRVLEDEMFQGDDKMRIDLQTPGKTSVIIDNKLTFD